MCKELVADNYPKTPEQLRKAMLEKGYPGGLALETALNATELHVHPKNSSVFTELPYELREDGYLGFNLLLNGSANYTGSAEIFCNSQKPDSWSGDFSPFCFVSFDVDFNKVTVPKAFDKYRHPDLAEWRIPSGEFSIKLFYEG